MQKRLEPTSFGRVSWPVLRVERYLSSWEEAGKGEKEEQE